jgi:ATP-dependent Clp protease ATP-binding subunit ClpC
MTPPAAKMPLHIREAERLGHNGIGCEHLLLGVLADEDAPAAKVLAAHGLTLDAARRRVAEKVGDGWRDSVRWSHSPRATVVLKLAEVEAERLGQLQARPGHLLLAMITEGAGIPMALFDEFGVDVGSVREDLLDALEVPGDLRELYLRQRTAYEQARRWRRPPWE